MNRRKITCLLTTFFVSVLLFGVTGCGPNFGEKLDVNGTEIYYKNGVKKEDAERLAKKLEAEGFVDGKKKSVQLLKRGDVWEFRMAVGNKAQKDEKVKNSVRRLCLELSSAFGGDKVEIHLANSALDSISVVKGLRGKKYTFDKTNFFYREVSLEQVKQVSAILFASGFASEPGVDFHISQPETTIKIQMATGAQNIKTKQLQVFAASVAKAASSKVFDGKTVEFVFCDNMFEPVSMVSTDKASNPSNK